jgi:hypothetical protein
MNNCQIYMSCVLLISCINTLVSAVKNCRGHSATEALKLSKLAAEVHLSTSVATIGLKVMLLKELLFVLLIEREIKKQESADASGHAVHGVGLRPLAEIEGSNPAGGMDVCLL